MRVILGLNCVGGRLGGDLNLIETKKKEQIEESSTVIEKLDMIEYT